MDDIQELMNQWLADESTYVTEPDEKVLNRYPPRWPEIVTPNFIDTFLEYLDSIRWDNVFAHIFEDELHTGVLAAIAEDRCLHPELCAYKALKSHRISFKRCFNKKD